MSQFILMMLTLGLSGCAFNDGFPREVQGDLKPINSQSVIKDVE
jgi:hypothetical protein